MFSLTHEVKTLFRLWRLNHIVSETNLISNNTLAPELARLETDITVSNAPARLAALRSYFCPGFVLRAVAELTAMVTGSIFSAGQTVNALNHHPHGHHHGSGPQVARDSEESNVGQKMDFSLLPVNNRV